MLPLNLFYQVKRSNYVPSTGIMFKDYSENNEIYRKLRGEDEVFINTVERNRSLINYCRLITLDSFDCNSF